jgi:hypothetical protein
MAGAYLGAARTKSMPEQTARRLAGGTMAATGLVFVAMLLRSWIVG